MMRAAMYARVSTHDQKLDPQLDALRAFCGARGWALQEFTDFGLSGAKRDRPGLDALLAAARARRIDVVVATRLDRLARSLHQLVAMAEEFRVLGVELVVTDQQIDTTTPTGRLLFHVLSALAEFERELIRERVLAGLRYARQRGRHLGRPRLHRIDPALALALHARGFSLRAIGKALGNGRPLHPTVVKRALEAGVTNPAAGAAANA